MSNLEKRSYHVEALRFILASVIVLYHILHSAIIPYTGEASDTYNRYAQLTDSASLLVQCFLVMGGYYLYGTLKKKPAFWSFLTGRFIRLWPVLAFSVLILVLTGYESFEDAFLDMFMLRATGLSLSWRGIIWYIGPFFWCSVLIGGLFSCMSHSKATVLVCTLSWIGYGISVNYLHGGLGRDTIWSWLSLAMVNVFGGLTLGMVCRMLQEAVRRKKARFSSKMKLMRFSLVSIFEISYCIYLFMVVLLNKGVPKNKLVFTLLFALFFAVFSCGEGILSKAMNNRILGLCGKYSYCIYMMQQISFYVMMRTIWVWFPQEILLHPKLMLLLSTIISILFGIGTYYAVEKPALVFWKKHTLLHIAQ